MGINIHDVLKPLILHYVCVYCKQHTRTLTHLAKYKRVVQKKNHNFFSRDSIAKSKVFISATNTKESGDYSKGENSHSHVGRNAEEELEPNVR